MNGQFAMTILDRIMYINSYTLAVITLRGLTHICCSCSLLICSILSLFLSHHSTRSLFLSHRWPTEEANKRSSWATPALKTQQYQLWRPMNFEHNLTSPNPSRHPLQLFLSSLARLIYTLAAILNHINNGSTVVTVISWSILSLRFLSCVASFPTNRTYRFAERSALASRSSLPHRWLWSQGDITRKVENFEGDDGRRDLVRFSDNPDHDSQCISFATWLPLTWRALYYLNLTNFIAFQRTSFKALVIKF